jgi:hypothetical protein
MEETKICKKCFEIKNISQFGNRKEAKDGLKYFCKKCEYEISKAFMKTKKGITLLIYDTQVKNSKERNHPNPEYSRNELLNWLFDQSLFHELYDKWVESNYNKWLKPSVDRKNDSLPYTMSNIQLMTWGENQKKAYNDMRLGEIFNNHKPVSQFSLSEVYMRTFPSLSDAYRETGVCTSNIRNCCIGKKYCKSAGGFIWRFVNNTDTFVKISELEW